MSRPMPVPGEPPLIRFRGLARRVLCQIVRGACPPDVEERGLCEDVVRYVEESLAYTPRFVVPALWAGLVALETAARADSPGHKAFSRLSLHEAQRYVAESPHSKNLVRSAVIKQVRMLALMGYYEHPSTKARLGYDPDGWIEKSKAKRLALYVDDVR